MEEIVQESNVTVSRAFKVIDLARFQYFLQQRKE
jgi:hypothetical protein